MKIKRLWIRDSNGKFIKAEMSRDDVIKQLRGNKPKQKESCFICGEHQLVTESHHLFSVAEYADKIIERELFELEIPNPLVFLCPNHHRYLHLVKKGTALTLLGFSDTEVKKYQELQARLRE